MPTPNSVTELVQRFTDSRAQYRQTHYNETQTRIDFVNPFFAAKTFFLSRLPKSNDEWPHCEVFAMQPLSDTLHGLSRSPSSGSLEREKVIHVLLERLRETVKGSVEGTRLLSCGCHLQGEEREDTH